MNRLSDETSPYLLQHADNPVDWWPWSDEALALARQRYARLHGDYHLVFNCSLRSDVTQLQRSAGTRDNPGIPAPCLGFAAACLAMW